MDGEGVTLCTPVLPPSVNKLYTVARGREILSREGRQYINYTRLTFAEQLLDYEGFGRNTPLAMVYDFHMPNVLNKGFPDKAKTKFKRIDVSNRVKVLEDVVCSVLDVDDSQVMWFRVNKWQKSPTAVYVRIMKAEDPTTQQRS